MSLKWTSHKVNAGGGQVWTAVATDGYGYKISKEPFRFGGTYYYISLWTPKAKYDRSIGGTGSLASSKKMAEEFEANGRKHIVPEKVA